MREVRLRRRTSGSVVAIACAAAVVLLLPESGDPRPSNQRAVAQATFGVAKTAPPSAALGDRISYSIAISYTGPPLTAPVQVSFTDNLPAQLVGPGMGAVQGAPLSDCAFEPQRVSCTVTFSPTTQTTVTFPITATATQEGVAVNTIQLSTGESATATTTITPPPPPPPGSVTVTKTGPETVAINPCCVPPKVPYTITIAYSAPIPSSGTAWVRFTDRLPGYMHSPDAQAAEVGAIGRCSTEAGPMDFYGPIWTNFSCTAFITEARRSVTVVVSVRPSGRLGVGTNSVELENGASASATTTFTRPPPPPPPPAAPAPLAGPPAAPTKTAVETFTQPGETETQSATIAASAKTTQVALTWPDADSSFDATGFRIVRDGQVVARAPQSVVAKVRPGKLRISKRRTARSLDVRIKGLRPGKLIYRIVARRLDGRTRVVARVRQSRRG